MSRYDNVESIDDLWFEHTTFLNQIGIIYKNSDPWLHDFDYGPNGIITPQGYNLWLGKAGNLTTGAYASETWFSSFNVGLGQYALRYITDGFSNVGIGMYALQTITTGYYCTGIGESALSGTTTGHHNFGLGFRTLQLNVGGNYNVAIGNDAGRNIVGGGNNVSGSNNFFLGSYTKPLLNGDTNEVVIGNNTDGKGSNTVTIGDNNILKTYLKGEVRVDSLVVKPGSAPGSPEEGEVYMDSTTHKLRCYDGTIWNDVF